jgi:hypothetical protein
MTWALLPYTNIQPLELRPAPTPLSNHVTLAVSEGAVIPLEMLILEGLACQDKSCAPPPIGTGGSKSGSGSTASRLPISVSSAGQSPEISELDDKTAKQALEVFTGRVKRGTKGNPGTVVPHVPGMGGVKTLADAVDAVEAELNATIDVALANGYTREMAQTASHWYPTANHYLGTLTDRYQYRYPETGAAVAAALSPSAEWGSNVTNAKTILQLVHENRVVTSKDVEAYTTRVVSALEGNLGNKDLSPSDRKKIRQAIERAKSPERQARLQTVLVGKRFNDIRTYHAAVLAQAHVQGNELKTTAFVVSPDGKSYSVGYTKNKATVQSLPNTIKALEIARADKRGASIDEMMPLINDISQESKVRAFYMNLAYPKDRTQNAITADTHALGSLLGTPFNAKTAKPYFESFTQNKKSTYNPGYPVYRAALSRALQRLQIELGVSGDLGNSAAQSVIWEMERYLMPEGPKGSFIADSARRQQHTDMKNSGATPLETKTWLAQQMGGARDRMEPPITGIKEYTID